MVFVIVTHRLSLFIHLLKGALKTKYSNDIKQFIDNSDYAIERIVD